MTAPAADWVRSMFGRIAFRYDLANHLLSMNIDRWWRARTVRLLRDVLARPGARVLDLCCGTGDLLIALQAQCSQPVLGADFCHPMLLIARKKIAAPLFEADALQLPLRDASLDLVTMAFGFRNLADYDEGLAEARRVLRPSGVLAILEFSQPSNPLFGRIYNWYSNRILPVIGGALTGSRDAYNYLPESVNRFPPAEELAERIKTAGFLRVEFIRMTGGAVALHLAARG